MILQLATRIDNLAAPYHKSSFWTKYETGLRILEHVVGGGNKHSFSTYLDYRGADKSLAR